MLEKVYNAVVKSKADRKKTEFPRKKLGAQSKTSIWDNELTPKSISDKGLVPVHLIVRNEKRMGWLDKISNVFSGLALTLDHFSKQSNVFRKRRFYIAQDYLEDLELLCVWQLDNLNKQNPFGILKDDLEKTLYIIYEIKDHRLPLSKLDDPTKEFSHELEFCTYYTFPTHWHALDFITSLQEHLGDMELYFKHEWRNFPTPIERIKYLEIQMEKIFRHVADIGVQEEDDLTGESYWEEAEDDPCDTDEPTVDEDDNSCSANRSRYRKKRIKNSWDD